MATLAIFDELQPLRPLCKIAPDIEIELQVKERGGLSKATFTAILDKLSAQTCWLVNPPVRTTQVDQFYDNNMRSSSVKNSGVPTWMQKKTLGRVVLNHGSGMQLVLTRKSEVNQKARACPPVVRSVRVKNRISFDLAYMRYDLTVVWTGLTSEQAVRTNPTYEVEIEVLPFPKKMDPKEKHQKLDLNIAGSLVEKGLQLINLVHPDSKFYDISLEIPKRRDPAKYCGNP